jgi:TPR repeat protein
MRIRLLVMLVLTGFSASAWAQSKVPCKQGDGPAACKLKCEKGSQESCAILGVMHLQGAVGAKPDYRQAERLLKRAWSAKVALGCGGLGSLYGAIKHDFKRARALLEKGCSLGDALSCESVGGLLLGGDERQPPPADITAASRKANVYYKRACDLGSANGCGFCAAFIADKIVPGTTREAVDLYLKACSRGMATACRQGVSLLNEDTPESKALATSVDAARLSADVLKRGCELGDAKSCAMSGTSH